MNHHHHHQPRHGYAPGVIERHRRSWLGTPAQRRELLRWARWAALWLAVAAAAGLCLGISAGPRA